MLRVRGSGKASIGAADQGLAFLLADDSHAEALPGSWLRRRLVAALAGARAPEPPTKPILRPTSLRSDMTSIDWSA